jgi:hypothetical protein
LLIGAFLGVINGIFNVSLWLSSMNFDGSMTGEGIITLLVIDPNQTFAAPIVFYFISVLASYGVDVSGEEFDEIMKPFK